MSGSGETKGWARVTAPTRRLAGWSPADLRRWPGRSAAAVQLRADVIVPTVPNDLSGLVGGPDIHWDGLIAYIAVNRGWIDGVVVEGEDPTADPDSLLASRVPELISVVPL